MESYLLIDLSYFIFYTYYAKKRYYTIKELNTTNLINNEEFLKLFSDFEKKIKEIIKKLKIDKNVKVLFARDCKRKDIWRNEIFNNYKDCRKADNEVGEFFKYTSTSGNYLVSDRQGKGGG